MSYAYQLPASAKRQHSGGQIGWQVAGYSGSVWWSVAFADLQAFINVAFASLETIYGSTKRYFPLRHPDYPFGLIANNANVDFVGWDTTTNNYSHALVRVDFYSPSFGLSGQQAFQTVTIKAGSEIVTVPGWSLLVGGVALNQDAGVSVTIMEISIQQFQVAGDNSGTFAGLLNHTNNAPMTIGSLTGGTGSILFSDAETEIQSTIGNVITYKQTLSLVYRSPIWGMCMTPSGWAGPATFPDGSPQYPQADLTVLFPS